MKTAKAHKLAPEPAPAGGALPSFEPTVRMLAVGAITASPMNPRKTFKDVEDLAADVAVHGVLQPVLVRPKGGKYELVFGERRWRAATMAGLQVIPAMVRELEDAEALEIMIVENQKRADVHPLEEADGYRELHEQHGYEVETIAAKVGKSKAYIYGRMKLCGLSKKARKAFLDGKLSAAVALYVARIHGEKVQDEALAEVTRNIAPGEQMSARYAFDEIQRRFMLRLGDAPFNPGDLTLVPKAGGCTTCPKRTGNQPELFGDVKNADVCTDPTCHAAKVEAHWAKVVEGKKVLSQTETKEVFPYGAQLAYNAGYVELKARCPEDPKNRTYKQLLGPDAPVVLARDTEGGIHELLPKNGIAKALKSAGVKLPKKERGAPDPYRKQQVEESKARKLREAVFAIAMPKLLAVAAADSTGEARPADPVLFLRLVAQHLCDAYLDPKTIERHGLPENDHRHEEKYEERFAEAIAKKNHLQLQALVLDLMLSDSQCYSDYPRAFRPACELYGYDLAAAEAATAALPEPEKPKKKRDDAAEDLDAGDDE